MGTLLYGSCVRSIRLCRDVTGLNTGAGHSALHQLGMHRIHNFQIRPDPDMLDPPRAGSDPRQTKLTTTMCITLLRWTCTKTDVWRFVYDICSLACPVIFSCWQWHHVSSEMLKIKNLCSISLMRKHFSAIRGSGSSDFGSGWFWIRTGSTKSSQIQIWIRYTPSKRNKLYLPLPSQPQLSQLVLIYRPWRDGRLNRPWCKVAPAEIRTCNLRIANTAL